MKISNLELKLEGAQIGLRLYCDGKYFLTYTGLGDCITDLVYHFSLDDLDAICEGFSNVNKVSAPFRYRGVCSELFEPTDSISRYVFFANSLSELVSKFEEHEIRAIRFPDKFTFGVQGIGIHLFNEQTKKYELWLGGDKPSSVSDILLQAKRENKILPDYMLEECAKVDEFDVFISHKSEDFKFAKLIYDKLISCGRSAFLSEVSLPAISNADYSFEIDKALGKAKHIVVVATAPEKITSGWVQYEWSSFANEKRSGRKNGNIITVLYGMSLEELPYLLRQYEVIGGDELDRVVQLLPIDR